MMHIYVSYFVLVPQSCPCVHLLMFIHLVVVAMCISSCCWAENTVTNLWKGNNLLVSWRQRNKKLTGNLMGEVVMVRIQVWSRKEEIQIVSSERQRREERNYLRTVLLGTDSNTICQSSSITFSHIPMVSFFVCIGCTVHCTTNKDWHGYIKWNYNKLLASWAQLGNTVKTCNTVWMGVVWHRSRISGNQ